MLPRLRSAPPSTARVLTLFVVACGLLTRIVTAAVGGIVSPTSAPLPTPALSPPPHPRLSTFSMITPPPDADPSSIGSGGSSGGKPPALRRLDTFSAYVWPHRHDASSASHHVDEHAMNAADRDEAESVAMAKAAGVALTGRHHFGRHNTPSNSHSHAHSPVRADDDSLHAATTASHHTSEELPERPERPPSSQPEPNSRNNGRNGCGCGCVLGWALCWMCRLFWWCVLQFGRVIIWALAKLGVHRTIDRYIPNFMRRRSESALPSVSSPTPLRAPPSPSPAAATVTTLKSPKRTEAIIRPLAATKLLSVQLPNGSGSHSPRSPAPATPVLASVPESTTPAPTPSDKPKTI